MIREGAEQWKTERYEQTHLANEKKKWSRTRIEWYWNARARCMNIAIVDKCVPQQRERDTHIFRTRWLTSTAASSNWNWRWFQNDLDVVLQHSRLSFNKLQCTAKHCCPAVQHIGCASVINADSLNWSHTCARSHSRAHHTQIVLLSCFPLHLNRSIDWISSALYASLLKFCRTRPRSTTLHTDDQSTFSIPLPSCCVRY